MSQDQGSSKATVDTRRRFDRNAFLYEILDRRWEKRSLGRWRKLLWKQVEGKSILEVGVGTGMNIPFYPPEAEVSAIDLSPRMLKRARDLAVRTGSDATLEEMDVQRLEFPDFSFDAVISSFVFCAVSDPVLGLREIARVLRPGGRLYMLEHVLPERKLLARMMRLVNPLVNMVTGENIDRQTRRNLELAGFRVVRAQALRSDIFWMFVAQKTDDLHAGEIEAAAGVDLPAVASGSSALTPRTL